jgi:hypothetical protein
MPLQQQLLQPTHKGNFNYGYQETQSDEGNEEGR